MIAIDIGNTTTVLALFRQAEIVAQASLPTGKLSPDAFAQTWRQLTENTAAKNTPPSSPAGVAAVVPAAGRAMQELLAGLGVDKIQLLNSQEPLIMTHDLETPETTGVDRLLAARAGRELYAAGNQSLVVVQVGSAVTVDYVDREGVFRGGLILPGPEMWLEALSSAAGLARAKEIAEDFLWVLPAERVVGRSTREALAHGLATGLPGAVSNAVHATLKGAPSETKVLLTGGWAEKLRPLLTVKTTLTPDLVLHGIRLVLGEPDGKS